MKSKKSFLSLGIIALVLFLGVGYAVVSSVYLNIGGTASVNDHDLNVEITNAVATSNITDKIVDFTHVLSNKNLTSNFTLNEMVLDEEVTITYTVTNNEKDVDAQLALASGVELSNTNPNYFDVDYEITDSETDLENNDKTMEVVVTVVLTKTPVAEANSSTTVGLTLTASPKGGSTGAGSGTEVEATDIYYNQPYNAVVSTETVASDTATYAKNGQAYNVTNLYSNISELQVNARTLADTDNQIVKTLVVYDDFSINIFEDGALVATYPASSVAIEGKTINVTDGFEAQISSDFKTITIGEEVYEINTVSSPPKIGEGHMYSGIVYDKQEEKILSTTGFTLKNDNQINIYSNGNIVEKNDYYIENNIIYIQNDNLEDTLLGYVSIDGTQFVQKGERIMKYDGQEEFWYGRAYSILSSNAESGECEKTSFVLHRDGSLDILVNDNLVHRDPPGSVIFDGYNISVNSTMIGQQQGVTEQGGYQFAMVVDGEVIGTAAILENLDSEIVPAGSQFEYFDSANSESTVVVTFNADGTYTWDDLNFSEFDKTGRYIKSDKAVILEGIGAVFDYDSETGELSRLVKDEVNGWTTVKMVPIK